MARLDAVKVAQRLPRVGGGGEEGREGSGRHEAGASYLQGQHVRRGLLSPRRGIKAATQACTKSKARRVEAPTRGHTPLHTPLERGGYNITRGGRGGTPQLRRQTHLSERS